MPGGVEDAEQLANFMRDLNSKLGLFVAAFRDSAEELKAGNRQASFPIGSFPPGLPFVRALPP